MSDTVNFAELDGQHVELLPPRTVLSMFSADGGGLTSDGAPGIGTANVTVLGIPIPPGSNSNGVGGAGTSANG
jgi:hypothetical protein